MAITRETINLGTLAVVVTRDVSPFSAYGDITVKVECESPWVSITIERVYQWTAHEWSVKMRSSNQAHDLDAASKVATLHAIALEIMRDLATNLPPKPVED